MRRDAPDDGTRGRFIPREQVTPGSTLDTVLRSNKLRFGFWRHDPYYFTKDGKDVGFELELGDAMGEILRRHYPGLKVEWVEQTFTDSGGARRTCCSSTASSRRS